jgi:hypothetical protein
MKNHLLLGQQKTLLPQAEITTTVRVSIHTHYSFL